MMQKKLKSTTVKHLTFFQNVHPMCVLTQDLVFSSQFLAESFVLFYQNDV